MKISLKAIGYRNDWLCPCWKIPLRMGACGKAQISKVMHYNPDAAISVGYRVNPVQATRFCIRATPLIKEYINKGISRDDERLQKSYASAEK